ncbi:UDP-N-acetylmuramoyl-tripeptide--D-alanyl-D-alanine ligase, partial [Pseudomonas stutzeri]|nr:UDP-N-acetylmuramoyl-tripeptide--D-alanyl-D-alanine ligase [Stutzerimonas stutzeri]
MNDSLKNIASVLQANSQGDADITGVAFDSRQVKIGDLFVALVSEHDGHLYIQQALANGAVAVLVDDQHAITPDIPAIIVPDTLLALQRLGQYRREMVNPKVIAITGSNGKTTTKDMTAAILSTKFKTFKTPENYNNEIGVPMTLLSMPDDTEVLVVELGMDRPGQLTVLSHLVMPD